MDLDTPLMNAAPRTATGVTSLFVPHGAPTFALQPGAAGAALTAKATRLPRPRAIVIVSAHWDTAVPTVGAATRFDTIHDFSGFPPALYALRYPATGCPELAVRSPRPFKPPGCRCSSTPRAASTTAPGCRCR
jgi:aromatic ring-opening dioxygenase catalytic subunit (LigB family)